MSKYRISQMHLVKYSEFMIITEKQGSGYISIIIYIDETTKLINTQCSLEYILNVSAILWERYIYIKYYT